ncbi:hypothetical protein SteCoe_21198 [Stentor coeruleus]|uniref:Uncharacterized protein n=1 Tax=Stentor coeruleus TaxID=5963 RepID=A0A1R2BQ81_9CILI|nr:hypothetical protein SteCoe_21198 [Stentor coeruleus]
MDSLKKSHNTNNSCQLTPSIPQTSEELLLPPIHLKTSSKSNPNLKTKINLLEELFLGKKSHSPNLRQAIKTQAISIADFTGDKKVFFKKIGFWEAYKRLQNLEKDTKYHDEKSLSKPDKPYLMDLNTERKLAFSKQKVDLLSSKLSRILSPQYCKPKTPNYNLPTSPQYITPKLTIEITQANEDLEEIKSFLTLPTIEITQANEDLEEIKSFLTLPARANRNSVQLSPRSPQFNSHCHRNSSIYS